MTRHTKMSIANIVLCIASVAFNVTAAGSAPDDMPFNYWFFGLIGSLSLCAGVYFLGRLDEARKQAKA